MYSASTARRWQDIFGLVLPLVELRDYAHWPLDTLVFQDLETLDTVTDGEGRQTRSTVTVEGFANCKQISGNY